MVEKGAMPSTSHRIMIEEFGATMEEIGRCFQTFVRTRPAAIRDLCHAKGVDSSVAYARLRVAQPELGLPENPLARNEPWYDFLHRGEKKEVGAFQSMLRGLGITTPKDYEEAKLEGWPTLQNINDGYFGTTNNFASLLPVKMARR